MDWTDKEADAQPEPPMEPPYYGSWINGNTGEWHPNAPQRVIERTNAMLSGRIRDIPTDVTRLRPSPATIGAINDMLSYEGALEMPETAEEPPAERIRGSRLSHYRFVCPMCRNVNVTTGVHAETEGHGWHPCLKCGEVFDVEYA